MINSAVLEVAFLIGLSMGAIVYGLWKINHRTLVIDEGSVAINVRSDAPLIIRLGAALGKVIARNPRFRRNASKSIETQLMLAGNPYGLSGSEFTLVSMGAIVLGFIVGIVCMLLLNLNILFAAVFGILIAIYPSQALKAARKTRVKKVERELPYTMELLVMAMEAGMQLRAALHEVTVQASGVLIDEIKIVLSSINTGMSEAEALTAMSTRLALPNVDHLVTALVGTRSSGVGTYLEHLRAQVDRLRRERMEQAEKDARSMMVKITIPLALFFLPSIGILLLGPGLVQILHGLTAA